MRKIGLLVVTMLVGLASGVQAQTTAASANKIGWDQGGVASAADAQAATYRYYADGATTGIVLTGVVCTGTTAPYLCSAPFPAFTPGAHTLTLTAANAAGETAKSAPLSFQFVVVPSVPGNLRIQ